MPTTLLSAGQRKSCAGEGVYEVGGSPFSRCETNQWGVRRTVSLSDRIRHLSEWIDGGVPVLIASSQDGSRGDFCSVSKGGIADSQTQDKFSQQNGHRSSAAASSILITEGEMNVGPPADDLDRERKGEPQRDGKGNGDDQKQII